MKGKYKGDTFGDYVNDRNFAQWDTGKGYDIKTQCEIVKCQGRTKQEARLIVYDKATGLSKAYDSMESVLEEWEMS